MSTEPEPEPPTLRPETATALAVLAEMTRRGLTAEAVAVILLEEIARRGELADFGEGIGAQPPSPGLERFVTPFAAPVPDLEAEAVATDEDYAEAAARYANADDVAATLPEGWKSAAVISLAHGIAARRAVRAAEPFVAAAAWRRVEATHPLSSTHTH